ncbi:hypothetical protein [Hydrogenimonas sp.]
MKRGTFATLLSALLLAGMLLGSTHHHDDLKTHADCLVCTLQGNLSSADTPAGVSLAAVPNPVPPLAYTHRAELSSFDNATLFARAPPTLSEPI